MLIFAHGHLRVDSVYESEIKRGGDDEILPHLLYLANSTQVLALPIEQIKTSLSLEGISDQSFDENAEHNRFLYTYNPSILFKANRWVAILRLSNHDNCYSRGTPIPEAYVNRYSLKTWVTGTKGAAASTEEHLLPPMENPFSRANLSFFPTDCRMLDGSMDDGAAVGVQGKLILLCDPAIMYEVVMSGSGSSLAVRQIMKLSPPKGQ